MASSRRPARTRPPESRAPAGYLSPRGRERTARCLGQFSLSEAGTPEGIESSRSDRRSSADSASPPHRSDRTSSAPMLGSGGSQDERNRFAARGAALVGLRRCARATRPHGEIRPCLRVVGVQRDSAMELFPTRPLPHRPSRASTSASVVRFRKERVGSESRTRPPPHPGPLVGWIIDRELRGLNRIRRTEPHMVCAGANDGSFATTSLKASMLSTSPGWPRCDTPSRVRADTGRYASSLRFVAASAATELHAQVVDDAARNVVLDSGNGAPARLERGTPTWGGISYGLSYGRSEMRHFDVRLLLDVFRHVSRPILMTTPNGCEPPQPNTLPPFTPASAPGATTTRGQPDR